MTQGFVSDWWLRSKCSVSKARRKWTGRLIRDKPFTKIEHIWGKEEGSLLLLLCLVTQLWSTRHDLMNCSPLGSSVHGIFQARILEWVAISSSRDLPNTGSNPHLLHCWQIIHCWAIREAHRQNSPSEILFSPKGEQKVSLVKRKNLYNNLSTPAKYHNKNCDFRFPWWSVAKTLCSEFRKPGFNLWLGN